MIFDEFAWPFPDPFPMTATAWRRTIVQFIRDNAIAFTVDKSWRHASLEFDHDRESPSMVEMLDGINPQKRKAGIDKTKFPGRGLAADGVWMWDGALLNIAASIFKQLCIPNTHFHDGTQAYVRLFMPEAKGWGVRNRKLLCMSPSLASNCELDAKQKFNMDDNQIANVLLHPDQADVQFMRHCKNMVLPHNMCTIVGIAPCLWDCMVVYDNLHWMYLAPIFPDEPVLSHHHPKHLAGKLPAICEAPAAYTHQNTHTPNKNKRILRSESEQQDWNVSALPGHPYNLDNLKLAWTNCSAENAAERPMHLQALDAADAIQQFSSNLHLNSQNCWQTFATATMPAGAQNETNWNKTDAHRIRDMFEPGKNRDEQKRIEQYLEEVPLDSIHSGRAKVLQLPPLKGVHYDVMVIYLKDKEYRYCVFGDACAA